MRSGNVLPEACMTQRPRISLRLRQWALRCYEIGLYTVLLAMAMAVGLPAAPSDGEADAVQCGKAQSSALVMSR
jgi:hypothetical protein